MADVKVQPTRVIIIGAGWMGLAAAKTYLEVQPDVELTIIDEDSTVGGVWSGSRAYPGLIADSCAAVFDYSDFLMDVEVEVGLWEDLPAEKVHEYLERYTDKFQLRKRCRLNTRVERAERDELKTDSGAIWKVLVEARQPGCQVSVRETLLCDKLIVATGTSSTPKMPKGIDWTKFDGPIMHSKDIGTKYLQLISDDVHRVTVVGGHKSAVDVVKMCALAKKEVDWLIREDGYGPTFLFQARTKDGTHAGKLKAARASAIISPNILVTKGFWYWFLHSGKSWAGSRLLKWALSQISEKSIKSMYGENENTMKLAPDLKHLFWSQSDISILHDHEFMNMVAEGRLIHIYRASATSLACKSVHLSTGETLPCDAAVFATGWEKTQPPIFDSGLHQELGLPVPVAQQSSDVSDHWNNLDRASDAKVRAIFPMLDSPPTEVVEYFRQHEHHVSTTPFRLYRDLVPPALAAKGDRSLIILGTLLNSNIPTYAEVSSLWGIAYLENLSFAPNAAKTITDLTAMEENISMVNAWGQLKALDYAEGYPEGSGEIQNFTDLLMEDLGLRPDRKRLAAERDEEKGLLGLRAWYREWFKPYRGLDYKGLVAEYMASLPKT